MFELVLRAPAAVVEAVSDLLMDEAEALSVSVEDADAGSAAEQALFGEPGMPAPAAGWERSTLKALFETEAAAEQAATRVLADHGDDGVHVQALQETVVEGIQTNIPLHRELMVDAKFIEGGTNIHYLEGWLTQHKR